MYREQALELSLHSHDGTATHANGIKVRKAFGFTCRNCCYITFFFRYSSKTFIQSPPYRMSGYINPLCFDEEITLNIMRAINTHAPTDTIHRCSQNLFPEFSFAAMLLHQSDSCAFQTPRIWIFRTG